MEPFARQLVPIRIEEEMRSSYLDYSMSVIVGRALPDVRDGLKPVHRRILYAMQQNGLVHNRAHRKCANVVGEVLGKFHPHGDAAVYDALVRMAQPWNMRYLLVDGQGNFGSVDGDNAAAYRYTECRMTRLAEELLADIERETVDFTPTFDGRDEEPVVLPAAFPNLLVNGAEGIAVGMATKIPPHNLREVCNALLALIENPSLEVAQLMELVPGPDFPTAGTIYGREGVREAYETGRGRIIVRGHAEFEEIDGRDAIVITELPFQVNKASFQEHIAELVRDKKIEGIHTIRDESDRQGMRVVIELKKNAPAREVVLNHLYKHTALQTTFGVILLAIVNQQPRVLTLKQALVYYLGHRREVVLRRTRYELRKARERAHVLEGYRIALDHIDAVIALIRASRTVDDAREGLCATFGLSEIQAQAILDLRLQRLTGLERDKIEEEYRELMARIEWLLSVLGSESVLLGVLRDEITAVRDRYGDERRTRIVAARAELTLHDLVDEEDQVVTFSHRGYIKRTSMDEYRTQKRGGSGRTGMATRDEDFVTDIFVANTHGNLLVFTSHGRLYQLRVVDVPEAGANARGRPVVNLVELEDGERVATILSVHDYTGDDDLVFLSRRGFVKRTPLAAYGKVRASGLNAVDVRDDDELLSVVRTPRSRDLLLSTRSGRAARFAGASVREMGRTARGVRGIRLRSEDDRVVSLAVLPEDETTCLVTVTANGFGKRTPLADYPRKGRGSQGVFDIATDPRNGPVVEALVVAPDDQLLLVTDTGRVIRLRAADVRLVGRRTRGVRLMRLAEDERIVAVTRFTPEDDEAPEVPAEAPPVEDDAPEDLGAAFDDEDDADDGDESDDDGAGE